MNRKRIICILTMLFSVFVIYTTSVFAQGKKVDLKVGKTKQLNITRKGKIKWKSKNSNIVKVSNKGKIRGIKKGKTKIIAMCGKRKKVFLVNVKNSYYKANFKNAKKLVVRNLNNGQTKEFSADDILILQNKLNKNKFYRKTAKGKLSVGDVNYMFSLYDNKENLLCSISVGKKKMFVNKGEKSKEYISKKTLNIRPFEF